MFDVPIPKVNDVEQGLEKAEDHGEADLSAAGAAFLVALEKLVASKKVTITVTLTVDDRSA